MWSRTIRQGAFVAGLAGASLAYVGAAAAEDMRMLRPEDMPCNSLCRAWMGWPDPEDPPVFLHPNTVEQTPPQAGAGVAGQAAAPGGRSARRSEMRRVRSAALPLPPERPALLPPSRPDALARTPVAMPAQPVPPSPIAAPSAPEAPLVDVALPAPEVPAPLALPPPETAPAASGAATIDVTLPAPDIPEPLALPASSALEADRPRGEAAHLVEAPAATQSPMSEVVGPSGSVPPSGGPVSSRSPADSGAAPAIGPTD